MSWQAAGTRFKASAWNEGGGYGQSVVLPVETLVVAPVPYRPEGSTQQELYDGRMKYLREMYGIKMNIEYQFERTDFRPSIYDTMADLISLYHNYQYVDFFVQYKNGSYTSSGGSPGVVAPYKCPKMIPNVTENVGKIEFQDQSRRKRRSLELRSAFTDKTFAEVNWLLD